MFLTSLWKFINFWGPQTEEGQRAAFLKIQNAYENVRLHNDAANFNWTFIFILAVVFYVYWTEIKNKN